MKLNQLIESIPLIATQGNLDVDIQKIEFDSRNIGVGDLFVAIKGTQVDGHQFIEKAVQQGAIAVLAEEIPENLAAHVTGVAVADSQKELAGLYDRYYGHPLRHLQVIGITGTNGKSTSVTLLHRLFNRLGYLSGLISTIEYKVGEEVYPSSHTTPDPGQLFRLFAEMVEVGCEYCFMEVSSHALVQRRVEGIPFKMGLFTNITHDHLDYHGSFKAYIQAKKQLFDSLGKNAIALVNLDDKNGRVMVQNTAATVKTFGLQRRGNYHAKVLENSLEGLLMDMDGEQVWFQLLGHFNAYNLLMVYAAAVELGLNKREVLKALSGLQRVPGRFEVIKSTDGKRTGIVDYAHTPDALKNVLDTIRNIQVDGEGLITVVGCGGDRDRAKRPIMAHLAAERSDRVVLTSDNPRTEDPEVILEEMWEGVPLSLRRKVLRIENRREAIRTAVALAQTQDVVLVAGKGHETYQEIQGVKHPFDDREELQGLFTAN
ncbi:MAG: UDP-N-acetylmuramoyl-L-alanyl-D-glutamate--2,6-diaminopimelate ligase [Bacteroidota bacterium]